MISLSRRVLPGAQILLLLLAAAAAFAADLNPAALAYKSPDQLKWRDPTGAAGINQAVLVGDPEKPGLYVVMNRFKPGNFSRPHFHPNDRFITVIKRSLGWKRSEEHTSELQSLTNLVCRLLLEKKKKLTTSFLQQAATMR